MTRSKKSAACSTSCCPNPALPRTRPGPRHSCLWTPACPAFSKPIYNLGGDRSRAVIKVAGGAQFLDPQRLFNIGERNIQAFEEIITRNGLAIHARDLGGHNSRTLRFDLTTGNVTLHSPGCPRGSCEIKPERSQMPELLDEIHK